MGRKQLINKENVPLNPLDCNYENFKNFHPEKKDFYPQHLDLNVSDKRRKVAVETMYNVLNNLCEASNANLVCNAIISCLVHQKQ